MFDRIIRIVIASTCIMMIVFFLYGCSEVPIEDSSARVGTKMLQPPEGPDRPTPHPDGDQ